VRADQELDSLADRMRTSDLAEVIVTDPDGHLLGVVDRAHVESTSVHSGS